jgi:heptosyltransferase-2
LKPYKERKFFKATDKSFKITLLLSRLKLLNNFVSFLMNLFLLIFQSIFVRRKNDSNKIVIICLHRLGDTVFSIPTIKAICDSLKNSNVFIVSYPDTKSILELKFDGDKIVTINKEDFIIQRRLAKRNARMVIKNLTPEIIIDLTGSPASASLIISSGAKTVIGLNSEYFKKLYTSFIPIRKTPHFMDIYKDVLKQAVPKYKSYSYEFEASFDTSGRILILPFAIRKAKEWNLHKFIQLGKRLNKKYEVCLITPPNFIDDDIINEIKSLNLEIEITNTVNELIEKTKGASLFISNDSGPIYIANLLGKPTFTIYGPTNPKFSLPFGKSHQFYQKILPCSADKEKVCYTLGGIYCPSQECMNLITVDEIGDSINSFIKLLGIEEKNNNQEIVN